MRRGDTKWERSRREARCQQLTRMAFFDSLEKRVRAQIQAKRSERRGESREMKTDDGAGTGDLGGHG